MDEGSEHGDSCADCGKQTNYAPGHFAPSRVQPTCSSERAQAVASQSQRV